MWFNNKKEPPVITFEAQAEAQISWPDSRQKGEVSRGPNLNVPTHVLKALPVDHPLRKANDTTNSHNSSKNLEPPGYLISDRTNAIPQKSKIKK